MLNIKRKKLRTFINAWLSFYLVGTLFVGNIDVEKLVLVPILKQNRNSVESQSKNNKYSHMDLFTDVVQSFDI